MFLYEKSGLKVAEVFFDEPEQPVRADIIRYHHRSQPIAQARCTGLETLWIDLSADPDSILGAMNRDTRYKINRAAKDGVVYEFQRQPDADWLAQFRDLYDRFALSKGLAPSNGTRLEAMLRQGALDLSRMRGPDGEILVWHAHVRSQQRARLLHSASIFREMEKNAAAVIGRANRLCHWADMQRFRGEGLATFDFGGWYGGNEDQAKLRINEFKRGFGGAVVPQYNSDRAATWKGAAALYVRSAVRMIRGMED